MSTATEIEARIAEVSNSMKVHRDLSKQLHRKELQLRRQLNAANDPIAQLPLEVSSEIFIQCLHPWPDPRADEAPYILLNVCHEWCKIVLSTPTLWSTIRVVFPKANSCKEALCTRLTRARNRPLHIFIEITGPPDPNVLSLVWRESARLKCLSVFLGKTDYSFSREVFEGMKPPSLKSLTTFIFRGGKTTNSCYWSYLVRLLRRCPNLIHLTLDNVMPVNVWVNDAANNLVFPHLRRIVFAPDWEQLPGKADFLKGVSAPQLETLHLPMSRRNFTRVDFQSFLDRSMPPLQELVLDCSNVTGHALTEDALSLMPALAHLKLIAPVPPVMEHFFKILARPYSLLLPSLVHLRIRGVVPPFSDRSWKLVLDGLTARRTQIKHASITIVAGKVKMPPRKIFGSLMDLSADGLYFFLAAGQPEEKDTV
ncbi:hypothetical protein FB45DRAFT_1000247 [Roridomyces roridus]|uniref:F-box domain-containing protein n=1 Tax=Roridomyces roridus TaxID=1738132 RepID=A0AAD7FWG0_9AGAR|nr:hypothetical protein FB45DRAFT_1000247 [Roridomyces roridus]